ncbi:MAG: hypothetical protein PHW95_02945 [Patescibacteria group bacterium]|nr:hypothetical protein [Patescibacteria group bacterium]
MPEINLLPNELREKEEKELGSKKKSKNFSVSLSSPQKEKTEAPLTAPKFSLLSRLFYKPTPKARSVQVVAEEKEIKEDQPPVEARVENVILSDSQPLDEMEHDLFINNSQAPTEGVSEKGEADKIINKEDGQKIDEIKAEQKKTIKPRAKLFNFFKRAPKVVDSKIVEEAEEKGGVHHNKSFSRRHDNSDSVLDVNLIPADLAKRPDLELKSKAIKSGVAIFITILLIISTYLGITWYQLKIAQEIKNIEGQIKDYDSKIAAKENEKTSALDLQQRLILVKQLFDGHVYWTRFFDLLEKYTSSEVYYTNFSMVGQDKLVISAVGMDYQSVARQLVAFENATDFVKSVRIDSASAKIDSADGKFAGVNFNINLEFVPGVFLQPN